MEKIKAACIRYKLKDDTEFRFVTGPSHAYCIETFSVMEILRKDRVCEEQGFITTKNRFVDRKEAYQIALEAGQLLGKTPTEGVLYSEFVKYAGVA